MEMMLENPAVFKKAQALVGMDPLFIHREIRIH